MRATRLSVELAAGAVTDAIESLCADVCLSEGDLDQNVRAICTLSSTLNQLARATHDAARE